MNIMKDRVNPSDKNPCENPWSVICVKLDTREFDIEGATGKAYPCTVPLY